MWIVPPISSSSLESADSASPSGGCGRLRGAWVTSSGTPTPQPRSWHGWKTRPWALLLFGSETFATWTSAASRLGLTCFSPDSRVRTSATQGHERASEESTADFGRRSSGSPLFSNRASSCSRTFQPSPAVALTKCSETLPLSGLMRSGRVQKLERPVTPTAADDGSVWPSPMATDGRGGLPTSQTGRRLSAPAEGLVWMRPWVRCHCENWWCRRHQRHVHNCDCPPIEEWDTSPYHQDHMTLMDGKELLANHHISRPRLNPAFVAWLMAFPWWWTSRGLTSSAPSETQSTGPLQKLLFDGVSHRSAVSE